MPDLKLEIVFTIVIVMILVMAGNALTNLDRSQQCPIELQDYSEELEQIRSKLDAQYQEYSKTLDQLELGVSQSQQRINEIKRLKYEESKNKKYP